MREFTDKKEFIKYVGDWPTDRVRVEYTKESNTVKLDYGGNLARYTGNVSTAAYIAWQFHDITGKEYDEIWNKVKDQEEG